MTLTSYFHRLQFQWQVAKLQNTPENPVEAKQVVKAFFISPGTRGNKWRLLLASSPNSPLLSCWNGTGKKKKKKIVCISHIYTWQRWIFLLPTENFLCFTLFLPFLPTHKHFRPGFINRVHKAHNDWLPSIACIKVLDCLCWNLCRIHRSCSSSTLALPDVWGGVMFLKINGLFGSKCAMPITPSQKKWQRYGRSNNAH